MDCTPFAFDFAGETVCALPENALWWPRFSALLVADLHLEKGSWFAKEGQLLPPYDSIDTVTRLTTLAKRMAAQSIWCLGDNFHDPAGPDRMDGAARAALAALSQRHALHFILGNHDVRRGAATLLPGFDQRAEADIAGIMLRHEADMASTVPDISGHWHPKIRMRPAGGSGGRMISRACFVKTPQHLILPAFGSYTGGLDVTDSAMRPLCDPAHTVAIVPLRDRLLHCKIAAPVRVA